MVIGSFWTIRAKNQFCIQFVTSTIQRPVKYLTYIDLVVIGSHSSLSAESRCRHRRKQNKPRRKTFGGVLLCGNITGGRACAPARTHVPRIGFHFTSNGTFSASQSGRAYPPLSACESGRPTAWNRPPAPSCGCKPPLHPPVRTAGRISETSPAV